jgi:ATP-binding protein involved in chromosome partitioning
MKYAIPVTGGKLSAHFGHCEQFALFDIDEESKTITAKEYLAAPPHEPGLLPAWLAEKGASVIIAGGMGGRAQGLFQQSGIKTVLGAMEEDPETVVINYLDGTLKTGENICDH